MDLEVAKAEGRDKDKDNLIPPPSSSQVNRRSASVTPSDPVVTYARRSSIMQPTRQGSTFSTPFPSSQHVVSYSESSVASSSIAFPSRGEGYVVPARSRTGSMAGGEVSRRLLRTLSTVSIYESAEGLAGGLADLAPIGKYIVDRQTTGADAPASEMPREFGIDEVAEEDLESSDRWEKKDGKFFFGGGQKQATSANQHRIPSATLSRSHSHNAPDTPDTLPNNPHARSSKGAEIPEGQDISVQSLGDALPDGETSASRKRFLID
ncbi:hypothetical protein GYMLUDRAFT_261377 [Collybiopsis luxurians FD-317 M1]|uniref:Uncharacterized protein n=1 Tax=Collybiopsis luxurians FD-317 M1 TaxID=944289 RepID=A0A0D0B9M0_9AGAR|nr:hypothetical protein GYMLUDRAFT_261377 [Collybiopsis luxurians FD-317 M1]